MNQDLITCLRNFNFPLLLVENLSDILNIAVTILDFCFVITHLQFILTGNLLV